MNAEEKAKLRRRTFRGVLIAEILLFGLIVFYAVDNYHYQNRTKGLENVVAQDVLEKKSIRLALEYVRYTIGEKENLIAFPPPNDQSKFDEWAKKIENFLGQHAVVFLQEDTTIHWCGTIKEFDPAVLDSAKMLLTTPFRFLNRGTRYMLGEDRIIRGGFDIQKANYSFCVVQHASDLPRWGVVVDSDSSMMSFYRVLNEAKSDVRTLDPAFVLSDEILLNATRNPDHKTGLRAFYKGKMIFSSPNLDTTEIIYKHKYRDFETQFYSDQQGYEHLIGRIRKLYIESLWSLVVMKLLLALMFFKYYRTVRKLTEPECP